MKHLTISYLMLFVATCLFTNYPTFAQNADFGDAPDGGMFGNQTLDFPSLDASNCPLHTNAANSTFHIAKSWGSVPNLEGDSKQVNQDIDNGQPFVFVNLLGIPAPSKVTVPIKTTASHNPNKTLYLNVAIDVDNDYDYDNAPDQNWVVQNHTFTAPADTTIGIVSPGWFGFGSDLLLFPVWLRATVTDVPVPTDWNIGSAGNSFVNGETEDWFYTFGADPDLFPDEWVNPPRDPMDPDSLKKKRMPPCPPPKKIKCAELKHPKRIYVKCEQTKCVWFEIRNCGGDTLTDVNISFTLTGGTPPLSPPSVQPPGTVPFDLNNSGDKKRFQVCVTGWPCLVTTEGKRWARYAIKVSYDPDGLYWDELGEVTFGSDEEPYVDSSFAPYLAAEPVDSSDLYTWEATIGQPITKDLMVWRGKFFSVPWIQGNPTLTPIYLPPWAIFNIVGPSPTGDTTYYQFTGTPGNLDYRLDSAVFMVESDLPADTLSINRWQFTVPIIVNNVNATPTITQGFSNSYSLSINNGDMITQTLSATDPDIIAGKRDTLFVNYFIMDISADTVYTPVNPISYVDNGDGTGNFSWTPSASDIGTYKLVAVAWDYAFAQDTAISTVTVQLGSGIDDLNPLNYVLEQNVPNPFGATTEIRFGVPQDQHVLLEVYDIEGRLVDVLYDREVKSGYHTVNWDAHQQPDGIYFYQLKAGEHTSVLKAVKMK